MSTVITSVDAGSPAERAGIRAGEQLLMINHHEIVDVLDYRFFCYDPSVSLRLREADGTTRHLTIEKEEGEDLGLNFDTYLMDEPRPCSNHCLFCFVDQMPPNMRDTLYFKDDDARLSFLMGNYITLTNLTEREAQRIIDLRISPINVSVQATEPQLRRTLLGNKDADKSLEYMRAFGEAGIEMNGQIVLCPGINDGEVLEKTFSDLYAMYPAAQSVAVVPVGLTKYREGLYPVRSFTQSEADDVIRIISRWQKKCYKELGTRFVYASDEFYCIAGRKMPKEESYEDFAQIENGVGLFAQLKAEFDDAMMEAVESPEKKHFTIACGVSVAPLLRMMIGAYNWENLDLDIIPVRCGFFGGAVTVTGLITGSDLIRDLAGIQTDSLIITENMLRAEQDLFLDDMTLDEVQEKIGVPIHVVENNGAALADALLNGFGG